MGHQDGKVAAPLTTLQTHRDGFPELVKVIVGPDLYSFELIVRVLRSEHAEIQTHLVSRLQPHGRFVRSKKLNKRLRELGPGRNTHDQSTTRFACGKGEQTKLVGEPQLVNMFEQIPRVAGLRVGA